MLLITSRVTRHTSHVTRHTSHVTRHTSHVTSHKSHATLKAVVDPYRTRGEEVKVRLKLSTVLRVRAVAKKRHSAVTAAMVSMVVMAM